MLSRLTDLYLRQEFIKYFDAQLVDQKFSYNSGDNDEWETVDSLRELVKKYVDPNFKV